MMNDPHPRHTSPRREDGHPADGTAPRTSLDRIALAATLHCLAGCSIGEVLGMVIGVAAQLPAAAVVALSIVLAFAFGYALTMLPLRRSGLSFGRAARLALAADTISIAVMEVVDNAVMLLVPGAMAAGLGDPRFWITLVLALALAGVAAFPVNRWLIARGEGHGRVHAHHGHG